MAVTEPMKASAAPFSTRSAVAAFVMPVTKTPPVVAASSMSPMRGSHAGTEGDGADTHIADIHGPCEDRAIEARIAGLHQAEQAAHRDFRSGDQIASDRDRGIAR